MNETTVTVTVTVTYTKMTVTEQNVAEVIEKVNAFTDEHDINWEMVATPHAAMVAILKAKDASITNGARRLITPNSTIILGSDGSMFCKGSAVTTSRAVRDLLANN